MKKWIFLALICISIASCGTKKTNENPEVIAEQEMQAVDSAAMETKARIGEISSSVDSLQSEVDSVLNEINKK
jgi:peptidoglycan hydrolase CwlO-like protein